MTILVIAGTFHCDFGLKQALHVLSFVICMWKDLYMEMVQDRQILEFGST